MVSKQQRTLMKLQRRKYLQPKYAKLLENFIDTINVQPQQPKSVQIRRRENSTTLSVLDREFHQIKDANEKILQTETGDGDTLRTIQEKVKPSKKKSKSKRSSTKTFVDLVQFKSVKKLPQIPTLPSIQPLQRMIARSRCTSKIDYYQSRQLSQNKTYTQEKSKQQPLQKKASLSKPPRFRAKMYSTQN